MKDLYTIGEIAKLFGISVQTLRNYSNLNLLRPQRVDENTGYRYYSFQQFHYIDRIKYLRKLGLSLTEIEEIIEDGQTDKLLSSLELQKQRMAEELKKLQETYDDISWYIHYFQYINQYSFNDIPYVLQLEKRYILFVDHLETDTVESVETRLTKLKSVKNLEFRRQYGYIAHFDDLVQKKFTPTKYFIYLKHRPDNPDVFCMELPAGEYLCFRGKIRTDQWDPSIFAAYFQKHPAPPYIIANEYEDNLKEYRTCPYEIQALITENNKPPGK
ncbi:MAG TPA: helix-turn-helix domain-containing protein [Patescibacteria group bacterium]|nr:helix-turn-helix domain-containing protein [Patescibacteria group bacterium]